MCIHKQGCGKDPVTFQGFPHHKEILISGSRFLNWLKSTKFSLDLYIGGREIHPKPKPILFPHGEWGVTHLASLMVLSTLCLEIMMFPVSFRTGVGFPILSWLFIGRTHKSNIWQGTNVRPVSHVTLYIHGCTWTQTYVICGRTHLGEAVFPASLHSFPICLPIDTCVMFTCKGYTWACVLVPLPAGIQWAQGSPGSDTHSEESMRSH